MLRLADVLQKVEKAHPGADVDLVKRAYQYASSKHTGQRRKSGEEYIVHPLGVADIIAELRLDPASVCAALLHDVVEDTDTTVEQLQDLFGEEVAFLVDGVTKLSKINFNTTEERQAENVRKMVVAMARDLRVILVKLADRLHNMRTLEHLGTDKQQRIARETMDIYAPLANRLGMAWVKAELEDLSFRYLHPGEWEALAKKVSGTRREREKYIAQVIKVLADLMAAEGVKGEVTGRPKHLFSIWRKMQSQGVEFEDVHDVIAFRILVDDKSGCYHALGAVHAKFKPVPGRFKDYIALPKPNGYQSLHTTVIGPFKERMEVQIRTGEMHHVAELGIAAHWKYKSGGQRMSAKDEERFAWLRQLMDWQQDVTDPSEFLAGVKVDLFADEVYVFTPRGDVLSFPRGATPVDFAYSVHTDVGHRTRGSKINGVIKPLDYQLRNGDTVEILTGNKLAPRRDWMEFVKTSRARTKIRYHLRTAEREQAREVGRQLWEAEAKRLGLNPGKSEKKGELEEAAQKLKLSGADELLTALGYGKIEPRLVMEQIIGVEKVAELEKQPVPEKKDGPLVSLMRRVTGGAPPAAIKVDGLDDVLVRMARCCQPVFGEPIVGFVTRGTGVSVHHAECRFAQDVDPQRRVEVIWQKKDQMEPRAVKLRVMSSDRPGMLMSMSQAFSEHAVNIQEVAARGAEDHSAVSDFTVLVRDRDQLERVMSALKKIQGVVSVQRVAQ
ncbi:MAG TPA: bifunctional (p)ppGpp synthetase/guanosine-3',5'-bis(diphosphate) 3'-pyrophosphohydrolase [Myxococcota bacterium]|jgi:GTP pyrophosphokinase|nr:bifunctional (p)ppGpp synthetase/guanosine-3',5'-bis(diphosphate) 3'-pyrophosphohydrolase [Myxococcota bacterium]